MKTKKVMFVLVLLSLLLISACGSEKKEAETKTNEQEVETKEVLKKQNDSQTNGEGFIKFGWGMDKESIKSLEKERGSKFEVENERDIKYSGECFGKKARITYSFLDEELYRIDCGYTFEKISKSDINFMKHAYQELKELYGEPTTVGGLNRKGTKIPLNEYKEILENLSKDNINTIINSEENPQYLVWVKQVVPNYNIDYALSRNGEGPYYFSVTAKNMDLQNQH